MRFQWQALTAHPYNKEHEFQNYIFALATEENYKILEEGIIKNRVEKPDMTVYCEDNQRKDNQRQMRQKTKCKTNNGNGGKKDIDPKRHVYFVNKEKC